MSWLRFILNARTGQLCSTAIESDRYGFICVFGRLPAHIVRHGHTQDKGCLRRGSRRRLCRDCCSFLLLKCKGMRKRKLCLIDCIGTSCAMKRMSLIGFAHVEVTFSATSQSAISASPRAIVLALSDIPTTDAQRHLLSVTTVQ